MPLPPAVLVAALAFSLAACTTTRPDAPETPAPPGTIQVDTTEPAGYFEGYTGVADSLRFTGEVRVRNIRQLTFGGNNAEAYWSRDGRDLIFQSDFAGINPQGCDQQFVMRASGAALASGERYDLVSTGQGRTTCGYFLPGGRLLYASTHASAPACPTTAASQTGRYVWDVFSTFDIYAADADGSNPRVLIGGPGYDAEATVSPDGRFVVFTSTRSGDLELWRYEIATGALLQLTDTPGYDGGAFFSPDGTQIVWRASRPTGDALAGYRALLAQNVVEPGALNLFVADADGSSARQVTDLPGANWAPFFHPDGRRILFTSNHHTMATGGREFDLFLIGTDGTGLERVTFSGTFDAFPMFSPDGLKLVFASNRRADRAPSRDTNIFVADWVERVGDVDTGFPHDHAMTALLRSLLVLLIAGVVAGCGADTPETPPADASSEASAPVTLRGVVVGTLYDGAALRVDHEAVPSLGMTAMTMAFPLAEPSLADGLSRGDKVALTIEAAPRLRVTAIEALPPGTALTLASDASATEPTASQDSSAAR